MNRKKIALAAATVTAVGGVALTGCGNEGQSSAPEIDCTKQCFHDPHVQVIEMPEGFRNVATACYKGNRIYVTSRGWINGSASKDLTPLPSDVAVVAADPTCPKA